VRNSDFFLQAAMSLSQKKSEFITNSGSGRKAMGNPPVITNKNGLAFKPTRLFFFIGIAD
jgi:hypothetical protein